MERPSATAQLEESLSEPALLRLHQLGPEGAGRLADLSRRGDWRTRALALSAIGSLARHHGVRGPASSRLRAAWERLPYLGAGRQRPGLREARGSLVNSLVDRVWFVRTAAALALGESGAEAAAALRPLLSDPYRPVRIAAAAALLASGATPDLPAAELVRGSEPAPAKIGDESSTIDSLGLLARAHPGVLQHWARFAGGPAPAGARAWAELLAGPVTVVPTDVREAEIQRYVHGKERHYNLTKPFTAGSKDENIWLLHSFLVVAENLRAPARGRILDLGGGAGWVSELLAKLGYQPVTLDLSPSLIGVGRDRFRRESLTPRFVGGDMGRLPFASGTFDAVVVIDALHHVPDVAAVFREVHRVLAQGGQFLLAEPGEGHAESELSRSERHDHGICEREIHLFEASRYGTEAGFDACSVIPHFIPALAMSPADLKDAMTQPSERWVVRQPAGRAAFDEYLLQGILCHPILAFAKGQRRLDSRLPGRLSARFEPALSRQGERVTGTVRVTNTGDTRWLGPGEQAGCVRLGFQLLTPERHLLDLDHARVELPTEVAAGGQLELRADFRLPDAHTPYVLKLDMVDEHICWFEDVGSPVVFVAV